MALLVVLSALVIAASVAMTAGTRSRTEALIASSLLGNAIVVGPVYVLGLLGVLDRLTLGVSVGALSVVLVGLFIRRHGKAAAGVLGRRALSLALLPAVAIAHTWRRRTLIVVGAGAAAFFVPYMLLVAYLAPAWRDWDGLWYHETIIAFTIQNRGFAMVPLPDGLQYVNGVQRLCEMTQLWFGIWGGRAVVDVANVFFMPLMAASMYALVHRYARDVATSVAAASAIVLIPAFLRLVQSTMVDPQAAALLLAAAYYVTHPKLDRHNAALAILALGLAVGAKIWFIVPVGLFSLYLLVRIVRRRRALGLGATVALVGFGSATVLGVQAVTYVRNWIHFRNPLWPVINYESERLGIHWKGIVVNVKLDATRAGVDFNDPFPVLWQKLTAAPYTVMGPGHTWQVNDYGFAWAWVVLPLLAIASVLVTLRWLQGLLLGAERGVPGGRDDGSAAAMMLAFVGAFSIFVSPAIFIGRYHVASLAMVIGAAAWLFGQGRGRRLLSEALLFAQLGSILMIAWAPSRHDFVYIYSARQIASWLATPYPQRELEDITAPTTGKKLLVSPVHYETGVARERELGEGSVIGFDDIHYAALLWNNDFSNRVVWLGAEDPLAEAKRQGAVWVYTRHGTSLAQKLTAASKEWELVGPLENENMGNVWRRRE
jgi:hypothetical protein